MHIVDSCENKKNRIMNFKCYFDGACEPTNPGGNMGMGALIIDENRGATIYALSRFANASKLR